MRQLILFLCVCSSLTIHAQLKGTALIPGQTNHSSIKVKFTAQSSTAITDSVFTASDGSYSVNINPGLYKVKFSKTGFRNFKYGNDTTILLNNNSVLDSVILLTGLTYSVSNLVNGTWETADTIIVTSDITVPFDSLLVIEPGVQVYFAGNYAMEIDGHLKAVGTPDQKIRFGSRLPSAGPSAWKGIKVDFSAVMVHFVMEDCHEPLKNYGALDVRAGELRHFGHHGIQLISPVSQVLGMEIHDYHGDSAHALISMDPFTNVWIGCNAIYDGSYGVATAGYMIFENNRLHNIGPGYAMNHDGNFSARNNVIYGCETGMVIQKTGQGFAYLDVNKNTLYANNRAIVIEGNNKPTLVLNIVVNNTIGIQQNSQVVPEIEYNLVWNNLAHDYKDVNLQAIGVNAAVNSNGDSVDVYNNLHMDPLFQNGWPPFVSPASPCINAAVSAFPTISPNIGAEVNSCFALDQITDILSSDKTESLPAVYPNPFTNNLNVRMPLGTIRSIILLDIAGRRIPVDYTGAGSGETVISTLMLPPGIYFLEVHSDNLSWQQKLIKQ